MAIDANQVVERIKEKSQAIAKTEQQFVLDVIDLGRLFVTLKENVKRFRWLKELKDLKCHPRVVSRYLIIGYSWWGNQTPGSNILAKLPSDLHKLEWLCRVTPDQLKHLLVNLDCRELSRDEVIEAVQRNLGQSTKVARKAARLSVEEVAKRWDDYVDRTLNAIDLLDEDDVENEEGIQQFLERLEAGVAAIRETLQPPLDGQTDQVDGDEEDSEMAENDEQEYAEEPSVA